MEEKERERRASSPQLTFAEPPLKKKDKEERRAPLRSLTGGVKTSSPDLTFADAQCPRSPIARTVTSPKGRFHKMPSQGAMRGAGGAGRAFADADDKLDKDEDVAASIAGVLRTGRGGKASIVHGVRDAIRMSHSFVSYYGGGKRNNSTWSTSSGHSGASDEDQTREPSAAAAVLRRVPKNRRKGEDDSIEAEMADLMETEGKQSRTVSREATGVSAEVNAAAQICSDDSVSDVSVTELPDSTAADHLSDAVVAAVSVVAAAASLTQHKFAETGFCNSPVAAARKQVKKSVSFMDALPVKRTSVARRPLIDPDLAESLRLRGRQWWLSTASAALSCTAGCIVFVDCLRPVLTRPGPHDDVLLALLSCVSVVQSTLVLLYHHADLRRQQAKDPLLREEQLRHGNSSTLAAAVEFVVTLLHCPPGAPSLSRHLRYLNILVYVRIAPFQRLIRDAMFTYSAGGLLAGSLGRDRDSAAFAVRTLLFRRGATTLSVTFLAILFVCTVVTTTAEITLEGGNGTGTRPPRTEWDVVWMQVITMSTVGFGDLVPGTLAGRLTAVFSAVLGIVVSTISVALLSRGLNVTKKEKLMTLMMHTCEHNMKSKELTAPIFQECEAILLCHRRLQQCYAEHRAASYVPSGQAAWARSEWDGVRSRSAAMSAAVSSGNRRVLRLRKQLQDHRRQLDGVLRRARAHRRTEIKAGVLELLMCDPLLVLQQDTVIQRMVIPRVQVDRHLSRSERSESFEASGIILQALNSPDWRIPTPRAPTSRSSPPSTGDMLGASLSPRALRAPSRIASRSSFEISDVTEPSATLLLHDMAVEKPVRSRSRVDLLRRPSVKRLSAVPAAQGLSSGPASARTAKPPLPPAAAGLAARIDRAATTVSQLSARVDAMVEGTSALLLLIRKRKERRRCRT